MAYRDESNTTCEHCGRMLVTDYDTEYDADEGGFVGYYTTVYCPDEHICDARYCDTPTHEQCADCALSVCDKHADPRLHDCPCMEAA
jgi:hypothetical protein